MNDLISIIIPVYDEEKNIPILYERIIEAMADAEGAFEIILVDDGSRDDSARIINELAEKDGRVAGVHFRRNFGQTAAMMCGIDVARGETLILMDGDLQNDPSDIPRLLDKLNEGYDVVSGWRRRRRDNPVKRTLPSRIANRLISKLSGVRLHDYGCSLKAYRRDVIKGVKLYGEMHRFIPIYASWHGAKVAEIPVNHHPRVHGESSYGMERAFKVVLDLLVVMFLARYSQKPMYVFGGFGLVNILLSFLCFALMLYFKYFQATSFVQTPLPLLSVLFFLMGFLSILNGLIAEVLMRTYFESQDKPIYITDCAHDREGD